MKWTELLRKDNYALLQSESDTQYAVASGYDPTQPEDQQWSSGTYFTYWNDAKRKADCLQNALDCFRSRTEENYVTKGQKYLEIYREDYSETAYTIKGKTMNDVYMLTGNNKYPDDCTIVSIKLEDMENSMAVVMPRFHIGARWFDDIVMNNAAREK